MAASGGDDGAAATSQAMLLDLARCSGMYGALIANQQQAAGGAAAFPPPPPPPAAQGGALLPPSGHALQAPQATPQDQHASVAPPYMLAGDAAATAFAAAQRSLRAGPAREDAVSAPTERAKRKKLMRQGQKELLMQLDSLLYAGSSSANNVLDAGFGTGPSSCPATRLSACAVLLHVFCDLCAGFRVPSCANELEGLRR